MTRKPKPNRQPEPEKGSFWHSPPGGPPIRGFGDWLAMMVQGGNALSQTRDETAGEPRVETRETKRKAIISLHGKDVEECEIPSDRPRKRVA